VHAGLMRVVEECQPSSPNSPAGSSLTQVRHRDMPGGARGIAVRQTSRRVSRQPEYVKLSVVMAAYNAQGTVEQAVDEVLSVEYPCDVELIIVDDGSTDQTPDLLASITDPRVVTIRHGGSQGKGAALLSGIVAASGTHVLPFDADLEYLPDDILNLLEPVLTGRCSVVYGVRLFGYNTVYRSYLYAVGNRILTRAANIMFGSCLSDLQTRLKLIPADLLRGLGIRETGFGVDTEISAALLRQGVRPFEVPVSYFGRTRGEGRKTTRRDAFRCLWILLRARVQPRRNSLGQQNNFTEPDDAG
jgi:glycosyltransferase involved in cell wall biosynthesis